MPGSVTSALTALGGDGAHEALESLFFVLGQRGIEITNRKEELCATQTIEEFCIRVARTPSGTLHSKRENDRGGFMFYKTVCRINSLGSVRRIYDVEVATKSWQ